MDFFIQPFIFINYFIRQIISLFRLILILGLRLLGLVIGFRLRCLCNIVTGFFIIWRFCIFCNDSRRMLDKRLCGRDGSLWLVKISFCTKAVSFREEGGCRGVSLQDLSHKYSLISSTLYLSLYLISTYISLYYLHSYTY